MLTKARVKWNQHADPDVVYYRVYLGTYLQPPTNVVTVTTNYCVLKSLMVGQNYQVSVTAINKWGAESNPVSVVFSPTLVKTTIY